MILSALSTVRASIGVLLALASPAYSAVCVSPISVDGSPEGFRPAPTRILLPPRAPSPYFFATTRQVPVGTKRNAETDFWGLRGNANLDPKRSVPPVYGSPLGDDATTDGEGRLVFVAGAYEEGLAESDLRWRTHLQRVGTGGRSEPFPAALLTELSQPRNVFWSDILSSLIVSFRSEDGISSTYAVRDDVGSPLIKGQTAVVGDFPSLGLVGLLVYGDLTLLDGDGNVVGDVTIPPTEDGVWTYIRETADANTIYLDGAWNSYAIHLEKAGESWQASSVTPVPVDPNGCRVFVASIRRPLFCDSMTTLVGDRLVPVAPGIPLSAYVGDSSILSMAILLDGEGNAYGYDGTRTRPIRGERVTRGIVHDLPLSGRVVLATHEGLYEIFGPSESLTITRLADTSADDFFTNVVELDRDTTVVVRRDGIYELEGDDLRPVWNPGDASIDITGFTTPTRVPSLGSLVFTTRTEILGQAQFHLASACH